MTVFLLNTLLALVWIALTGTFTPTNYGVGFAVGFVLLWIIRRLMPPSDYFVKVPQVIGFGLFYFWEILQANVRMLWVVLAPRPPIRPAVVAIPLEARTNTEVSVLANLITLTPGTLFLDVSQDRCVMYVHALYVDDVDAFRQELKDGLERRVLEILR